MKKYLIIFAILLIICCRKNNDFKFISVNDTIDFDTITKISEDRGILTMKSFRFREYNAYSRSELVDIDVPYVIYKRKGENCFYLIKNSDTLKFKIENN